MAAVEDQAAELNELDRRSGDGDFGSNIEAAVARARARLAEADTVAAVFGALSGAFMDTGGTSGPLYGMWFRELARAADGDAVGLEALAAGAAEGVATVQRLGRAEVGDKTMVDAMVPRRGRWPREAICARPPARRARAPSRPRRSRRGAGARATSATSRAGCSIPAR